MPELNTSPRRRIRRPRYADIAATLALVLAMSTGGAYAANTIGSNDIRKNAVKTKHVAKNAVKSKQIARKAVKPRHLNPKLRKAINAAGEQGPAGPRGAQGPIGPQGGDGVGGYEIVTGALTTVNNTSGAMVATCPAGKIAIGGGWTKTGGAVGETHQVLASRPWGSDGEEWQVRVETTGNLSFQAYAVCANSNN